MLFMRSFEKYLINEAAVMPSKSGWKAYILGNKLFVHIKSRKSPNFSRSEICNKSILKSPTIAAYEFSR